MCIRDRSSSGVNYFSGYSQFQDPGLGQVSPTCFASSGNCNGLLTGYSNKALVDVNGNFILVNPNPGEVGNLGQNTLRGPGRFDLDMNALKKIRIDEAKSVEIRVDVVNVLNHPNFGTPSTALNSNGTCLLYTSDAADERSSV